MALNHIICIDDESDILQVATMTLEMVGNFKVSSFSNGEEALEGMRAVNPDLVLMDVMMPGRTGPELFADMGLDDDLKAIPVIFMTARVQPAEKQQYLDAGAIGVVSKPFDPMTLSDEIREIWARSGREA